MLVMVGLCFALAKDLRRDPMMLRSKLGEEIVGAAVIEGVSTHGDDFVLRVEPVSEDISGNGRELSDSNGDAAQGRPAGGWAAAGERDRGADTPGFEARGGDRQARE